MGNSLFDQLKKTGLVNKARAQKVKHDKYKDQKQRRKTGTAEPVDEAKLLAERALAEKVARDRLANQEKMEAAESKAIVAQIIQLIETNRVTDRDGDVAYNFTDAGVVKRIFVSERVHKSLTSGQLSIARLGDGYELVPRPVADKIKQRDAQRVIDIAHAKKPSQDDDDLYSEYKIPDDLMW